MIKICTSHLTSSFNIFLLFSNTWVASWGWTFQTILNLKNHYIQKQNTNFLLEIYLGQQHLKVWHKPFKNMVTLLEQGFYMMGRQENPVVTVLYVIQQKQRCKQPLYLLMEWYSPSPSTLWILSQLLLPFFFFGKQLINGSCVPYLGTRGTSIARKLSWREKIMRLWTKKCRFFKGCWTSMPIAPRINGRKQ